MLRFNPPFGSGKSSQEAAARMSDVLTVHEETGGLRRPIIVMAFSGWNDAAESATTAARYLAQVWPSRPLSHIDPEEFYHFGLSRPLVRFRPGSRHEREVVWPATEFSLAQPPALERDLIVGVAIEPVRAGRPIDEVSAAPPGAAYLVLTHSHALDFEICAAVLERGDFAYLGLIGSATKRAKFERGFRELGIPKDRIARLVCPIGGGTVRDKRPPVIAALVAAELIGCLADEMADVPQVEWAVG